MAATRKAVVKTSNPSTSTTQPIAKSVKPAAPRARAAKKAAAKPAPRWPTKAEKGNVDPKTGRTAMSIAVEQRREELVEAGYERLNGMLPPEAAEAWQALKEAGFVKTRLQAITEGVLLLRDTRMAQKKK